MNANANANANATENSSLASASPSSSPSSPPSLLPSKERAAAGEQPVSAGLESAPSGDKPPPLSETIQLTVPPLSFDGQDRTLEFEAIDVNRLRMGGLEGDSQGGSQPAKSALSIGEALQFVRYSRRDQTLMITGVTPHGRKLTFEQRQDREGWYVVVAGRRRRPTERELGLVVASIEAQMEAAAAPRGEFEVRSAYRLAASSDQPGMPIRGLQAYRDLLLDEAEAYIAGQLERLAVVAIEYQGFKRFAIRHGHRIGAAFVRALGELLAELFPADPRIQLFHKTGKAFRLIIEDHSASTIRDMMARLTDLEPRQRIVERVWGEVQRTHPDEINFNIGIAAARPRERDTKDYASLAQRLNDDAYRALRLGQLKGHTSIHLAKAACRSSIAIWLNSSEDDLDDLASQMDDGPAAVMAEMSDYLHELVPADIEGMSVQGDVHALVHAAIAREGFWQGTTAMRIACSELVRRFLERAPVPEGENEFVGGFDLGDEYYGASVEGDTFYFCWGDINSAGATRTRAGLDRIQSAVGWGRTDGRGIAGRFLSALRDRDGLRTLPERVAQAAEEAFEEISADDRMHVNDAVDIGDHLWLDDHELVRNEDIVDGSVLKLVLPRSTHEVKVVERSSASIVHLEIDGKPHTATITELLAGPQIKLRVRNAVVSAAICILAMTRGELEDILSIVREDNNLPDDTPLDIVGFLRHIADIVLMEEIKAPSKIELALGKPYAVENFVRAFSLEEIRERFPGVFYESVHHNLINDQGLQLDRHLREIIAHTMLARTRPSSTSE
ncbi:MAG: GGDEF domain-containing protein [Deltaproteobacteria bacterium]|nr:GGDEF domain-containing protein [Deltaproteobacteria bacterium]